MKKITILAAMLLLMATVAQAQAIQRIFDKYSSDERFSYVSVGSGLMDLGASFMKDNIKIDTDAKEALQKMKGVRVLTLEANGDGKTKSVIDEFMQAIRADSKSEALVETREKGETTNIFFTSEGLLILTKDEEDLTVVNILGEFSKQWLGDFVSKQKK